MILCYSHMCFKHSFIASLGRYGKEHIMSNPLQMWRLDRRAFIGGSDARIIMGDDEAALLRLWREKRGEVGPEDLSGNLVVQLGTATEELNRSWSAAPAHRGNPHR
jgi:predicted phage-related endonuclease